MHSGLLFVIVLLLIYLNYQFYHALSENLSVPRNAGYVGYGYANDPLPYTSGATMRDCATVFSQPSQGAQALSEYSRCGPAAFAQGSLPKPN